MVRVDDFKSVVRYNSQSRSTSFDKVSLDLSLADFKGTDGSFRNILDPVVFPKDLVAPPNEAPVLYVRLFTLAKSEGAVLAVSLHHQVGDGSAQFAFVQAWANEAKGTSSDSPLPQVIHQRDALPQAPQTPLHPPPGYRYLEHKGNGPFRGGAPTVLIRFPTKRLQEIKAEAMKLIVSPNFVSTNDVLLALLFRSFVRAQLLPSDSPVFMKVVFLPQR